MSCGRKKFTIKLQKTFKDMSLAAQRFAEAKITPSAVLFWLSIQSLIVRGNSEAGNYL